MCEVLGTVQEQAYRLRRVSQRHDLAIGVFRFFHAEPPTYRLREGSTFDLSCSSGDHPTNPELAITIRYSYPIVLYVKLMHPSQP